MFLEHGPDVLKQDGLSQTCPKNMSCRPRESLRTFFGGPIGEPGRFATACSWPIPSGPIQRLAVGGQAQLAVHGPPIDLPVGLLVLSASAMSQISKGVRSKAVCLPRLRTPGPV
eukprot:852047-Pyramimonas_sp.AAC.1